MELADLKDIFEKQFPLPIGVSWSHCDSCYVSQDPHLLEAYAGKWDAFLAGTAIQIETRDESLVIQGLNQQIRVLAQQIPPKERGKNEYGLDVDYFRRTINRELNQSLRQYRPDEIARVFARLSVTADRKVLNEPEFLGQGLTLHPVSESHEDYGECCYLKFGRNSDGSIAGEPPMIRLANHAECEFNPDDWEYFIPIEWNPIFDQAEKFESNSNHS